MKKPISFLLLALACVGLPGGDGCDGNLGDVSPGAVSFRVSAAANFTPADGPSSRPTTNSDGSFVAFESRALNLTRTEPGFREILLRDRNTQTVQSVSRLAFAPNKEGLADCVNPSMSSNGAVVFFNSRRNLGDDPDNLGPETHQHLWSYFYDPTFPSVAPVVLTPPVPFGDPRTRVDGDCVQPSISGDGAIIGFVSTATNLDTFPAYTMPATPLPQIFVTTNYGTGTTRLVSHAFGAPGTPCNAKASDPVVSADGQWILFLSAATDLVAGGTTGNKVKVYRASLDGTTLELVSRMDGLAGAQADNHCASVSVNADGTLIGFAYEGGNLTPAPNSGTLRFPLIVRDYSVPAAPVNRVVAQDCFLFGLFGSGPKAPDRSFMTLNGDAIVYMRTIAVGTDVTDLQVRVVSTANGSSIGASKGIVEEGASALEEFWQPTISGDGRWVFWRSDYSQEVNGDTNALSDVFGYGPLR